MNRPQRAGSLTTAVAAIRWWRSRSCSYWRVSSAFPAASTIAWWKRRSANPKPFASSSIVASCSAIAARSSSSSAGCGSTRADGVLLDQQPRLEHVVGLARRDRHHQRAALGVELEQLLGLQLHERLPHRGPADAEAVGDVVLAQQRPAGEAPVEQARLDVVVGALGGGAPAREKFVLRGFRCRRHVGYSSAQLVCKLLTSLSPPPWRRGRQRSRRHTPSSPRPKGPTWPDDSQPVSPEP